MRPAGKVPPKFNINKGREYNYFMVTRRVRFLRGVAACVVMGISICLLVLGFWPQGYQSRALFFPADAVSLGQSHPVLENARTLRLVWPPLIRLEDSGLIRLSFEPGSAGGPTSITGSTNQGFANSSNPLLGDSAAAHMLVEARLDMAGVEADPSGMASAPLPFDQTMSFAWTVHPLSTGNYRGVVWLYLHSVSLTGDTGTERALAALPIDIRVVSFLGLGAGPVRILGLAGMLAGLILGLPFIQLDSRWFPPGPRRLFARQDENNVK